MKYFIALLVSFIIGITIGMGVGYSLYHAEFGQFAPYIERIKADPIIRKQLEEEIESSIDKEIDKASTVDIDIAESTPVRFGVWDKTDFLFNKSQYFKIKLINETDNVQEVSIKLMTAEENIIKPEDWQNIQVRTTSYNESGMELELSYNFSKRELLKDANYLQNNEYLAVDAQLVWKENIVSKVSLKISE